jgi:hypothetical protein
MLGDLQTRHHRLLTRRCVECGYDGPLLRGGQADHCAKCGCDLRLRPARSYAEMEGLLGMPLTYEMPSDRQIHIRRERLIHRWLAFLFMVFILVIMMAYLSAAALAV